jgi:hypothetical protein
MFTSKLTLGPTMCLTECLFGIKHLDLKAEDLQLDHRNSFIYIISM